MCVRAFVRVYPRVLRSTWTAQEREVGSSAHSSFSSSCVSGAALCLSTIRPPVPFVNPKPTTFVDLQNNNNRPSSVIKCPEENN